MGEGEGMQKDEKYETKFITVDFICNVKYFLRRLTMLRKSGT